MLLHVHFDQLGCLPWVHSRSAKINSHVGKLFLVPKSSAPLLAGLPLNVITFLLLKDSPGLHMTGIGHTFFNIYMLFSVQHLND